MAANFSLQILHMFESPGPLQPASGVLRTADGSLYGVTPAGNALEGGNGSGTVYKITPDGQVSVLAVVHSTNGYQPSAGLAEGLDGHFYGSASLGPSNGWSTIFKITPDGLFTNIFIFYGTNGYIPGPLTRGAEGTFYGTTFYGGAGYNETNSSSNGGTVFKLTPAGEFTLLHSFTGTNGFQPMGRLMLASNGNFYGTTAFGGQFGLGTIFSISPAGAVQTLVSFDGTNGTLPSIGLVEAPDGWFYGMTEGNANEAGRGSIFKVSSNGTVTTVASFNGANGRYPSGSLVTGEDGQLYGVTKLGGAYDGGTAFRVTTNGVITVLASFDDATGRWPTELTKGADGNLYGTASVGFGTVFRLAQMPEMDWISKSNGVVQLRAVTFPGGIYQVQYKSALADPSWNALSGRIASQGNSISFQEQVGEVASRFYRLVLLPW